MLSASRSFISTYWPDWIFATSLGGNGAKAEDSLSAWPPAPPTAAIALVDISDGKGGSKPPLTTLVLVTGTDRLRDVVGMHATNVIADGGGIRPKPAGMETQRGQLPPLLPLLVKTCPKRLSCCHLPLRQGGPGQAPYSPGYAYMAGIPRQKTLPWPACKQNVSCEC